MINVFDKNKHGTAIKAKVQYAFFSCFFYVYVVKCMLKKF